MIVMGGVGSWVRHHQTTAVTTVETPASSASPSTTPSKPAVVAPIGQFKERVTKKFFGTYITPSNSPIQPERFTGYHTGIDVEYTDVTDDVPVYAIADGSVIVAKWASGYGGVVEIKHSINGRTLYAIYGHLRPSSLVKVGSTVSQGQQIAVLGTGYSDETDGERRHLHFGIAISPTITGYVAATSELNATWIDPLSLYP